MTDSFPIVTFHLPGSQLAAALSRVTTHLLNRRYAFQQTFYHAGHIDCDIFNPSRHALVRLTLHSAEPQDAAVEAPAAVIPELANAETAQLVHHLLQVCRAA